MHAPRPFAAVLPLRTTRRCGALGVFSQPSGKSANATARRSPIRCTRRSGAGGFSSASRRRRARGVLLSRPGPRSSVPIYASSTPGCAATKPSGSPSVKREAAAPQPFEVECELPIGDGRLRARTTKGRCSLGEGAAAERAARPARESLKISREASLERLLADGLRAAATPYGARGESGPGEVGDQPAPAVS